MSTRFTGTEVRYAVTGVFGPKSNPATLRRTAASGGLNIVPGSRVPREQTVSIDTSKNSKVCARPVKAPATSLHSVSVPYFHTLDSSNCLRHGSHLRHSAILPITCLQDLTECPHRSPRRGRKLGGFLRIKTALSCQEAPTNIIGK